jgi:hypothetical protein
VEHTQLYASCGDVQSYSSSGKHCLRRPGVDNDPSTTTKVTRHRQYHIAITGVYKIKMYEFQVPSNGIMFILFISNYLKIGPVFLKLTHADGQTDMTIHMHIIFLNVVQKPHSRVKPPFNALLCSDESLL